MKSVENRASLEARVVGLDEINLGDLKIGDKFIDCSMDLAKILGYDSKGDFIVQWLNPDVTGVSDYEDLVESVEIYNDKHDLEILKLLENLGIVEGSFNISEVGEMVYPYEKWIPDTKLARKLYKIIDEDSGKVRIL